MRPDEDNMLLIATDGRKAALDILHETCFSPALEVECTLAIPADAPRTSLVLVPTTYGAAQAGPFSIELACDGVVHVVELK